MTKYPERKAKSGLSPGLIVSSPRRDFNWEKVLKPPVAIVLAQLAPSWSPGAGGHFSCPQSPLSFWGWFPRPLLDSVPLLTPCSERRPNAARSWWKIVRRGAALWILWTLICVERNAANAGFSFQKKAHIGLPRKDLFQKPAKDMKCQAQFSGLGSSGS